MKDNMGKEPKQKESKDKFVMDKENKFFPCFSRQ